MANFSLNAKRIRDLAEYTPEDQQQAYMLIDAADSSSRYSTYKMSINTLMAQLSANLIASTEFKEAIKNYVLNPEDSSEQTEQSEDSSEQTEQP